MSLQDLPVREWPGAVCFTKTISEFDVYSFAGITGDFYPVHINAEYAAKQPVGERVAHGILLMGLMSTAAGRWMLEQSIDGLSYGYEQVRFVKPIRFGDTVSVFYARERDSDDGHKIYSRVEARNQHDEVIGAAQHIVWQANPADTPTPPPTPPKLPAAAWINEPAKENINTDFVA